METIDSTHVCLYYGPDTENDKQGMLCPHIIGLVQDIHILQSVEHCQDSMKSKLNCIEPKTETSTGLTKG